MNTSSPVSGCNQNNSAGTPSLLIKVTATVSVAPAAPPPEPVCPEMPAQRDVLVFGYASAPAALRALWRKLAALGRFQASLTMCTSERRNQLALTKSTSCALFESCHFSVETCEPRDTAGEPRDTVLNHSQLPGGIRRS